MREFVTRIDETNADLREYVYRTAHAGLLRDRARWIDELGRPSLAMWWLRAGTLPTVAEAAQRLESIAIRGPTADAFTFATVFAAPA